MELTPFPTQFTLEGRVIGLHVRRHRRARRITLRLSPSRDGIAMTLPARASLTAGMKFLFSKAQWVLENIEEIPPITFTDGAELPVLGHSVTLRNKAGRGVSALHENELFIYGKPEFTARRTRDFLKKYLREECMRRAQAMAKEIGKTVRDVKIRDTRSRWGSCSAVGALTFNWRLVFAPSAILDYLIAHEVAHCMEMNHSERFWHVVGRLFPDYKKARSWLKRSGHLLHNYG